MQLNGVLRDVGLGGCASVDCLVCMVFFDDSQLFLLHMRLFDGWARDVVLAKLALAKALIHYIEKFLPAHVAVNL